MYQSLVAYDEKGDLQGVLASEWSSKQGNAVWTFQLRQGVKFHNGREMSAEDVVWSALPLFHFNAISICVVGTLVVGGSASIARRFSVSRFWPEVKRTNATIVSLLGSLAILIADAEDHPDQHDRRPGR